jgi:hypothetical protein
MTTTIDRARLAIPLLQAIVEGKDLQFKREGVWVDDPARDADAATWFSIMDSPQNWRIKPQPREWWFNEYKNGRGELRDSPEAAKDAAIGLGEHTTVHVIEAP